MTIEELKQYKRLKGYTYAQMARLSGVPQGTIQKIFNGETTNPRYDTMQALERLFEETMDIREETVYSVGTQGHYTVEDYYAIPDERRVELIDGYIYDMSSPNTMHQQIVSEIGYQLRDYIKKNGGDCTVFMAPLDVRLDCDNRTMVQPDLMILCDKGKLKKWGIMGAPDFILEVISPSTRNKDYALKAGKYMNAKVREYWVLDPYKQVLIKYDYENEAETTICGLDNPVPVEIYGGNLEILFDEVIRIIKEYEEMES